MVDFARTIFVGTSIKHVKLTSVCVDISLNLLGITDTSYLMSYVSVNPDFLLNKHPFQSMFILKGGGSHDKEWL